MLEALLVSTGLVALAEIGDKTQLLSLVLAARFRRPWPIVWGILAATLLNHSLAGALGAWLTRVAGEELITKLAGVSFLAMAAWVLVPDKLDDAEAKPRGGVFWTTTILFFIAEMGDKTQVATVVLAARYDALAAVVAGTTLGMMIANVPVVFFGEAIAKRLPLRIVRRVTAALFAILGVVALIPQAGAQELTLAGGGTRASTAAGDESYALLAEYSHFLSPHLSASFSYRNEGHIPSHHRDGHSVQLWYATSHADGFALRAGVGPYRYFDTEAAENPQGFRNAHGWGAIYSLAATWRAPASRWTWQVRVDRVQARDSFDTWLAMLGAGYRLDQDPRETGEREYELALMAGRTVVNSFESEGAGAGLVELRGTLGPSVRASLGFMNEGDARLIRRNGFMAQLWLEPSFGGERFTFGVGIGPYVAMDRVGSGSEVLGVIGTTFSYRFARGWAARITWNRVASNYDRDSDIITAGIGYRF